MSKQSGFTLVEIMIAIALIGLLAAIGSVSARNARNKAKAGKALGELQMLATAIDQLAWDTGRWPNGAIRTAGASGANEVWNLSNSGLINGAGYGDGWKGPYFDDDFRDPWWKDAQGQRIRRYFFDSDYDVDGVNRIVVGSFGPNGEGQNVYDDDNLWVALDDLSPQTSEE